MGQIVNSALIVFQDVSTNTIPSSEENVSKSTTMFIKSNLPPLRSMAEDVDLEKLNQWMQTHTEVKDILKTKIE